LFRHTSATKAKKRINPVAGKVAIVLNLTFSIGYILLRTVTITLTPILTIYFGIHGLITVILIPLEIAVLPLGILEVRRKTLNK
jgi:hypothetical protein